MRLQREVAKMPQVELPTNHYFADGMYCRELFRPAGTLIVGKVHLKEHFYIVASGTVCVTTDQGVREVTGPEVIVSQPGTKRAVLALTDATCFTVHRTELTDLDEIERELIEPDAEALFDARNRLKPLTDQDDYKRVVMESGYSNEEIQRFCTNEADRIPMPEGFCVEVRDSQIHGKGIFACADFVTGEIIAPARIGVMRTPAGRYTNHSINPNGQYVREAEDRISLVATRDIPKGGEITINYRESALFSSYQFRRAPCLGQR